MTSVNTLPPYWVELLPEDASAETLEAAFGTHYPVRLRDGGSLSLPLRPLPGGDKAIALLMSNQTSFTIERELAARMTALVRDCKPDAVIGIPTMGLPYARLVAETIGLPDYVALGLSRKFWYDDALSEPIISSTSPTQRKQLYLDPALTARIADRRVIVVDDVLNTGSTMVSALRLLRKVGAEVITIVAVLSEGWAWHRALGQLDPTVPRKVQVLGHIPMFEKANEGWMAIPDTTLGARPTDPQ